MEGRGGHALWAAWLVGLAALSPHVQAALVALPDVKVVCPGNVFEAKNGACVAKPDELKKLAAPQCKGPTLKWEASKEDENKGECKVDKAPSPVCEPDAYNFVIKDGKCFADTDPEATKSKEFFGNWAIGVAVVRPNVKTVVDAAIVPAGAASGATPTVRVNSQVRHESSMLVARHFYPWNPGRRCAQDGRYSLRAGGDNWDGLFGFFKSCVGTRVAVGLPTSGAVNGQVINFAGLGLALGSGPAMQNTPLAWHVGLGWGRKFNHRVLGDGWTENAPPPEGETQVRYKTIDVPARFIYFTVHW